MGNVWYNEPKTLDTAFDDVMEYYPEYCGTAVWRFTVRKLTRSLIHMHRRVMINI